MFLSARYPCMVGPVSSSPCTPGSRCTIKQRPHRLAIANKPFVARCVAEGFLVLTLCGSQHPHHHRCFFISLKPRVES